MLFEIMSTYLTLSLGIQQKKRNTCEVNEAMSIPRLLSWGQNDLQNWQKGVEGYQSIYPCVVILSLEWLTDTYESLVNTEKDDMGC